MARPPRSAGRLVSECNSAGFRLALGLALVASTILALSPQGPQPFDFDHGDKLGHLLTFTLLGFLADAGWPARGLTWGKFLPLAGYGAGIEVAQHFVPNRFFSIGDIAADTLGVLVYFALFLPLLRRTGLR